MATKHRVVLHDSDPNREKHWLGVHAIYFDDQDQQISWNPEPEAMRCLVSESRLPSHDHQKLQDVLIFALRDIMESGTEILSEADLKQPRG